MLKIRGGKKGVSLMEVLIALFILSVVGAVVVGGVFTAVQGNSVSRNHILAEGLARYELEYVKSVAASNWTGITNQVNPYTIPSAQGPLWDTSHNSLPSGYEGYTIVVTISSAGAGYDSNIRKVNAAVSYQGDNVISIETYVIK
jgi:prepilin-type N-terminal cleavage/methylation domain-containing protein